MSRLSRWFLAAGCKRVRTHGVDRFVRVLNDKQRIAEGRGVLTCTCSAHPRQQPHLGVRGPLSHRLDEPLVWGALPAALFRDPYSTRWSLGASDIIFKNAYVIA